MKLYKRYISVIQKVDKNGAVIPLGVLWDQGVYYQIDKILEVRNGVSQVGGCGILYRCMIEGHTRQLYYEVNRWFMESTKP